MGAEAGKRVTAADVARSLGLSRATVGFVLNGTSEQRISEATKERVLAEAARLGYRPHTAAQALRRGSSKLVLLVVPDWPVEFSMSKCIEEAAHALEEAGYSLVTQTRHPAGTARPLWELLDPEVVVGFTSFTPDELAAMRGCGITKIIPGPPVDSPAPDPLGLRTGPRLQVEHLHGRGHTHLGFAATAAPRLAALVESRLRLAQETAAAAGLPPLVVRHVDDHADAAGRAVHDWLDAKVTGVVAYNDESAARVVRAAVRAGHRVPADLAVIGHDDNPYTGLFVPSISSIRIDYAGLGRHLAALALHEAAGRPLPADEVGAAATVVARESTGPGRAGR
ncbi:LacI family DNA-binding transcriptional regulator [Amycolatopsis sp.]|uniref:LacI family DNA-binding transcriptional regulator n=1 Tax=Amycolatopsis sp. TaxID=37632 RepID=UPI002D7ED1BD|nr:LacI family DNA-binding transcriptional regulator [Amycolatopsis sp.]HET6706125.1 LacI family DNA-binding transcriptional regulator [Amycolatopsis sp.]